MALACRGKVTEEGGRRERREGERDQQAEKGRKGEQNRTFHDENVPLGSVR
jgi:hypothetical protein